jgi:tetratricopeptide (TPR) repeat protein
MEHDADFYAQRSEERFHSGDIEGGLADLDQSIALDANNPQRYWERAILRYEGEEYELAIEDLSKIIELSTDREELQGAYIKRAISHQIVGKHDKVVQDLDWLISQGLADSLNYAWRASYMRRWGRYDEAIQDMTTALQLSPETDQFLLQRATIYYRTQQYENAVADLTKIIEAHDADDQYLDMFYHLRGKAYYRLNRRLESLHDFNQIRRFMGQPLLSDAHDYMKFLHEEL